MVSPEVQHILDDKPFAGKLIVRDLRSLAGEHALSGKTYLVVEQDGKIRYKLRACVDEARAKHIEQNLIIFQRFFPKFYGRDRNYILTEALQGYRISTREELMTNAQKIGRMCAEIHQSQIEGSHDMRKYFYKRLNWLKENKVIDDAFYQKAAMRYEVSVKNLDLRVALDLSDIHEGNIMINKEGNMLFVDEDAMEYRVKGLGLAKLLKKMQQEGELREFLNGYNEVANGDYLTPEYRDHLLLVETVRSIAFKLQSQTSLDAVPGELERLKRLVS